MRNPDKASAKEKSFDRVTLFMRIVGIIVLLFLAYMNYVNNDLSTRMERGMAELGARITDSEARTGARISELGARISDSEAKMDVRISDLETKMDARMVRLENRLEAKFDQLSETVKALQMDVIKLQLSLDVTPAAAANRQRPLPLDTTANGGLPVQGAPPAVERAEPRPE
ncbi:MAG: hypothetical protein LBR80_16440 [Deltaproteobacteria bacterium]|nr:hypothetical protein [Deltaproteobacteria bacterium]